MQKVDPQRIEMIRRREKAGFCFINRSFLAEKVQVVPSLDDLAGLAGDGWWDTPATISDFINDHDGQPAPVETRLRIVYDDQDVLATFWMHEPAMDKTHALVTAPGTREIELSDPVTGVEVIPYVIEKDDHIQLLLDFTHHHGRYVRFLVNQAGVGYADQVECNYRSESVYPSRSFLEKWDKEYQSAVVNGDDHWCAAFRIPFSSIGARPDEVPVFGIDAGRSRTVTEWNHHVLYVGPNFRSGAQSATDFGDLYLGQAPIALEEADFGHPVLAANTFTAKIRNTAGRDLSLLCKAELTVESTGELFSTDSCDLALPAGATKDIQLSFTLDWQERRRQTLRLSISDKDAGSTLLVAPYFFAYNTDIPAEQPHEFDGPQPDPDPADENFIVKKRHYLLSRLPQFIRPTTADGAPSDFTLQSICGKYEFNLMKSGILRDIAGMIEEIFEDPNDRLAAVTLLAHQKTFSMHMSPHVGLHRQITPLSALRLNAGHCYSRMLVWLGIVSNMTSGNGDEFYGRRAHGMLVLGHVIGAIDVGDDRIFFDPSPGAFFYHWDNTRFATANELRADPALVNRMVRNCTRFYSLPEYYRAIPAGQIVFPQGAVGE